MAYPSSVPLTNLIGTDSNTSFDDEEFPAEKLNVTVEKFQQKGYAQVSLT
jgi:hypothetical protein